MRWRYPDNWASMTPLARGDYERRMGAFSRRVRFLGRAWARDPARWKRVYWDGEQWRISTFEIRT